MSGKYLEAREAFATKQLSWTKDAIVACLLDAGYTFDEGHSLRDIAAHIASEIAPLKERKCVDGDCRASGPLFRSLVEVPHALAIYREGGPLIVYLDDINGLPQSIDYEVQLTMPETLFTV